MSPEPAGSPIPVIIVENPHEGMTTGELWVSGTAIALALVTLLTFMEMVRQDERLIGVLRNLVAVLARRKGAPVPSDEPDDTVDSDTPAQAPIPGLDY